MLVLFRCWSCVVLAVRWGRSGLGRTVLLGVLAVLPASGQIRPRPTKPAARPALVADPPAVRIKLFQAAALANSFKDSEALAVYQEILKEVPTHYLALWQAAVLSVKIGTRYSDETRKSAYFDLGRQYADRALLLRPEGGESNYAVALALFNQATLYRAGARLKAFSDLRSHVYLATERRPDLPETWQLRGRWQYRVAHYNLIERLYSKLVLGGVPPGGDSKEAMADLEKARELSPKNLQFCYDLARMYVYQGRRRRAIAVLREAERLPTITSEDLVVSRLCRKMLPPLLRADARRRKGRLREGEKQKPVILAPDDSIRARRDTLSRKQ
jgi:tetratricopeptide (TPR) repeat protein